MMLAIPADAWRVLRRLGPTARVATRRALAQQVRLKAERKSPRGPKQPRPKRAGITKAPHVSTAKLLKKRQINAATP
jgi:hypothetical protein